MFYFVITSFINLISSIIFRIKISGEKNIPRTGACIVCFNHTSLLDPPVVGSWIKRRMHFMGKQELFDVPVLGFVLKSLGVFPVRRGVGDVSAIKNALGILKKGNALAMYPEGTRNKDGNVADAKAGIAFIATKAQVPIIPVAISGEYKFLKKLYINIGEPIILDQYKETKPKMEELQEISNGIMEKINSLKV